VALKSHLEVHLLLPVPSLLESPGLKSERVSDGGRLERRQGVRREERKRNARREEGAKWMAGSK